MILFFLVGSVCAQMTLLHSALSDGGAQVEPHYYDRAVSWEDEQAARARIDTLHYSVVLHDKPDAMELELLDASGGPIQFVSGEVVLSRPHLSDSSLTHELDTLPSARPGHVNIERPKAASPGLWDITVSFEDRQGREFLRTFRRQW